ncbi:MAG: GtrA family protein [Acidimicrobiales bacterium]
MTPDASPSVSTLASVKDRVTPHSLRAGRFLLVTVINNNNHQGLLYTATSIWGWSGGKANLFAGFLAAIPAYLLSRAWVWGVRGRRHDLRREVLPFLGIAGVGLAVSTVFAEVADRWFGSGLMVNLATLIAYFLVWVAKYLLLDRLFVADPVLPIDQGTST